MSLTIAAVQSASIPGHIAQNVTRHVRLAKIAADHGVQLVIFPELSLTGYELDLARASAVRPDSSELDPLRQLAVQARMTIVAGAPLAGDGDRLHIGALALLPDASVVTYAKEYVHESEQHVFTSGPGGPTLNLADAAVALAICADASHPEHAARAAGRGANIYAAGVMITEDDSPRKTNLLKGYAPEHKMAVLMANYSGTSGGWTSAGRSAIWSEDGKVVAASEGAEQALVIAAKQEGLWSGKVVPVPLLSADECP